MIFIKAFLEENYLIRVFLAAYLAIISCRLLWGHFIMEEDICKFP